MKRTLITPLALGGLLFLASCQGKPSRVGADSSFSVDSVKKDNSSASIDSMKKDSSAGATGKIKPNAKAPAWAPDMKPEMLAVIEKLESYGDKPIETLSPAEARKNHTPTDAVMALMKENNIPMPPLNVDTMGKDIPGGAGMIHIRIYTPKNGQGPFPVILYYHGGGFVIADLDVYNASPETLSDKVGAVVISVAYRLAPEHKFPAAHEDAFAAYQWALKNAGSIKGNAKKIALVGESAGGNLAIATAIKARDKGIMLPTALVAVYPVAGADMNTASYQKNAMAKPLNKAMMAWFVKYYLHSMAEAKDPRINLVAANLKGLPPTTVITDEIDPLQSEGMTLASKLKDAGVKTDIKNYNGVTHEFFGMGTVIPEAKDAEGYAASQLKSAFGL